jgi:hypothetical protein
LHQAQLEAGVARGQLQARERVERGHVGAECADVAGELLHRQTRRPGVSELIAAADEFRGRRASQ